MSKKRVDDLAVFGGPALFDAVRPIGQLALPDEEKFFAYARSMYACRRVTNNGPLVQELERRLAEMHAVDHCIAAASASMALILLMHELAEGRRGEVIMPAFTYSGLPHLAQWAGQIPRFCDVDEQTHTLDPQEVARCLCAETTAVLAVHQVNSPCHAEELERVAGSRNVPLLIDSVHGIHCTYQGKPTGGLGRAEVFCLHATKVLNGFEGGYVTTNDEALAAALRLSRNFGIVGESEVACLGLNAKLNEVHAACALASLDALPETVERNRRRVEAYAEQFVDVPGLSWVPYSGEGERRNFEFALLEVDPDWPIGRDDVVRLLRAEQALARAYYSPPVHLSTHCPDFVDPPSLPVTERLSRRIVQMPAGDPVSVDDVEAIGELLRFAHAHAEEISRRLASTGPE